MKQLTQKAVSIYDDRKGYLFRSDNIVTDPSVLHGGEKTFLHANTLISNAVSIMHVCVQRKRETINCHHIDFPVISRAIEPAGGLALDRCVRQLLSSKYGSMACKALQVLYASLS